MTYFGPKLLANFKRKTPKRKPAGERREGMSDAHLANIRRLPSCVSGKRPCVAHHLRIASERGVGLKATDQWALPLTPGEHTWDVDCVHTAHNEEQERQWFLARIGIEPRALAEELWASRYSITTMRLIIWRVTA